MGTTGPTIRKCVVGPPGGIIRTESMVVKPESLPAAARSRFPETRFQVVSRAPGRVNLIGEHVDYCDGLVLPLALPLRVQVVAGPNGSGRIRAYSSTLDHCVEFPCGDRRRPMPPTWDAYLRGVVVGLLDAGIPIVGTDLLIGGDLPMGAGLGSSAALEVAVALSLTHLAGRTSAPTDLAQICRRAEHDFAGVPCGIMDQTASLFGLADHAILIDCRSGAVQCVPWADRSVVVLIAESGDAHELSESPYATRVEESRQVLEHFRAAYPEVKSFRDITSGQTRLEASRLEPVLRRRVRHILSETCRTADAAQALERGDFAAVGRHLNDSHASLRDDCEVSSRRLDRLAQFLRERPGVYGARMTGGGFGGCVVGLVQADRAGPVESALNKWYDIEGITGARRYFVLPAAGASCCAINEP